MKANCKIFERVKLVNLETSRVFRVKNTALIMSIHDEIKAIFGKVTRRKSQVRALISKSTNLI